MSSIINAVEQIAIVEHLSIQDQEEKSSEAEIEAQGLEDQLRATDTEEKGTGNPGSEEENQEKGYGNHSGNCAICLNSINLQEIALVKGCEHAYCVNCILQWATYTKNPTCPQCKHTFEFLNVHRSLDGSINDYMFEESVCLLLRAHWFKPLAIVDQKNAIYDDVDDYFPYEEEYGEDDDDFDEAYFSSSSSLRIGNRRWGDNGYVRGGRQQARPVSRPVFIDEVSGSSSSFAPRQNEASKDKTGRRAKRALKREAADKAAAAKHEQHLARFGRK